MEPANTAADSAAATKRQRSASLSAPAPKAAKTSHQLSINYLARQSPEDLPLINKDDTLPNLIHLLSAYSNILDRHESLASNLGATPLGPILIKRFERCFDAPPKVVASHHKNASGNPDESHHITWLEVIEFARSHPTQFTLSTFSEGRRVCQFYYPQKQLRVQISEEDFLFINSGRCQELIPPLPIWEDEEKEVATCDVLEAKLKELTNVADMVAARTRQLSHRLKGRRAAILERRAEGGSGTPAKAPSSLTTTIASSSAASTSTSGAGAGFVAVNASANLPPSRPSAESAEPSLGSSAAVRNELLRHFESLPHNQGQGQGRAQTRHHGASGSIDASSSSHKVSNVDTAHEGATSNTSSLSPVPTSLFANEHLPYGSGDSARTTTLHRPSSSTGNPYTTTHAPLKHNFSRPLPPALESSQPFRPLCQAQMDSLPRGHRVLPPCDRCRRLRMDCVKNLTSCAGCTRKHARCHWRDVSRDELGALDHLMDATFSGTAASYSPSHADSARANGYANGGSDVGDHHDDSDDDDSNPLEDLEALGEQEEQEYQQIREDEEGLRNAKELARQGYEDSLRSVPNPATDHLVSETISANVEEPQQTADALGQPEAVPSCGYDPVTDTPHRRLPSDDEIQVRHPGMTAEPPSKVVQAGDMPVSHGSFRAVNGSAIDSGTVLNGTGWRAV